MKKIFTLAACALIALTSCSKDAIDVNLSEVPSSDEKSEMVSESQLKGVWEGVYQGSKENDEYTFKINFNADSDDATVIEYTLEREDYSTTTVTAEADFDYENQLIKLAISRTKISYEDGYDTYYSYNTVGTIYVSKLNDKIVFEIGDKYFTCSKQ